MSVSHPDLVVLGLLSEGPRHGYELLKEVESMELRSWAKVADSTIYRALQRLEEQECLTVSVDREGNRPRRNVYELTKRGRSRLKELVLEALASGEPAYSDRVVGAVFSTVIDPQGAGQALCGARSRLADAARRIESHVEGEHRISAIGRVILRHAQDTIVAERRVIDGILRLSERRGEESARAADAGGSERLSDV